MIDALIGGLATGSLYSMLAVGFVLIFAATGVANFAQGSLAMVAAFFAFTAATRWGWHVWLAAPFGLAAATLTSYLVYTIGIRPLQISDHLYKGVATLAIDITIVNLARVIWGPSSYQFDSVFRGQTIEVGGLNLPVSYFVTFAVALASALLLQALLKYTRTGIAIRSVTQNPGAALLMGVDLPRISALSWAASGLLAGIAGILLAPVAYVSFNMMSPYLIRMFAAAALGGLTSVWGAVLGGMILGLLEGAIGRFVPATLIDVVSVLALLAVLVFRPQGLFGTIRVRRV
ncbi:MAG: branched-chain amino acid transport system permease protein [Bradyrhizobium sp.]|jgi:branched-chain amino acid transport system permease protein|nr:branched-chain amino acid transport system permease protein [Bradyrhizobium sp.]